MDGLHADIPKVISTCPRQSEEDFVKFNKRLECYAKKVGEICEKKSLFFCLTDFYIIEMLLSLQEKKIIRSIECFLFIIKSFVDILLLISN